MYMYICNDMHIYIYILNHWVHMTNHNPSGLIIRWGLVGSRVDLQIGQLRLSRQYHYSSWGVLNNVGTGRALPCVIAPKNIQNVKCVLKYGSCVCFSVYSKIRWLRNYDCIVYIYIPFEKWRAKELRIELPNLIVYELISKLA